RAADQQHHVDPFERLANAEGVERQAEPEVRMSARNHLVRANALAPDGGAEPLGQRRQLARGARRLVPGDDRRLPAAQQELGGDRALNASYSMPSALPRPGATWTLTRASLPLAWA